MRSRRRSSRVAVALIGLLAAVSALVVLAGPSAAAPGSGVYIALGDSYTSGPLIPNQYGEPIDCARSDRNYPSLIAEAFEPAVFVDVSCGSAQTKHMTEPQDDLPAGGTNPPQFNALRADATLVTVGIGGNDAGLVGVATKCAELGLLDPFGTACRDFYAPGGNDSVQAEIDATKPKIDAVLQGIHEGSPEARVAIVGYPNVLPLDGSNCYPMVPLSIDDVRYIDGLIVRINEMIESRAARNGAEFVDTYDDSIGHDVCKLPPTRWFEGLLPTEPAFPLHPNGKGEASMARSAISLLREPPSEAAPRISKLRVKPKRFRRGKVRVGFRLDRSGDVMLQRRRIAKEKRTRSFRPVSPLRILGEAGSNRVRFPARRMGKRQGRYILKAVTVASDGSGRSSAKARYRVQPKRR